MQSPSRRPQTGLSLKLSGSSLSAEAVSLRSTYSERTAGVPSRATEPELGISGTLGVQAHGLRSLCRGGSPCRSARGQCSGASVARCGAMSRFGQPEMPKVRVGMWLRLELDTCSSLCS